MQHTQYQDDLAKPEGRVYFAGEHTDIEHGWMDAAIKSGVRASVEMHFKSDWTEKRGYRYNK